MHIQRRQERRGWRWVLGATLLALGCGETEPPPPQPSLCADVTCAPPQPCQQQGVCDPATGQCSYAPVADGTACNDGSACTRTDTCQAGVCTGGDALSCPGVQHTYDTANRLVRTQLADGRTLHYEYDGNGMLVGMLEEDAQGHSKEVEFILDESSSLPRIIGAVDSEGHEALYLYGSEGLQAQAQLMGAELKVAYPVVDHQGTVRAVVDGASGQAQASFFEPFGALRHTTAEQGHSSLLGYTGEPLLPDGNVYLRARVYAPTIGRFLQRDTYPGQLAQPQSLNRYAWVEGQVTTATDPTGNSVDEYLDGLSNRLRGFGCSITGNPLHALFGIGARCGTEAINEALGLEPMVNNSDTRRGEIAGIVAMLPFLAKGLEDGIISLASMTKPDGIALLRSVAYGASTASLSGAGATSIIPGAQRVVGGTAGARQPNFSNSCGHACVSNVNRARGGNPAITRRVLERTNPPGTAGLDIFEVAGMLKALGHKAKAVESWSIHKFGKMIDLSDSPAILLRDGHYITIQAVEGNFVYFLDPAAGAFRAHVSHFPGTYHGVVVTP